MTPIYLLQVPLILLWAVSFGMASVGILDTTDDTMVFLIQGWGAPALYVQVTSEPAE